MCGRAGACEGPSGRVHRFSVAVRSGSSVAVRSGAVLAGFAARCGQFGVRVWPAGVWLSRSWSRVNTAGGARRRRQ
jgi:hypothetical protein